MIDIKKYIEKYAREYREYTKKYAKKCFNLLLAGSLLFNSCATVEKVYLRDYEPYKKEMEEKIKEDENFEVKIDEDKIFVGLTKKIKKDLYEHSFLKEKKIERRYIKKRNPIYAMISGIAGAASVTGFAMIFNEDTDTQSIGLFGLFVPGLIISVVFLPIYGWSGKVKKVEDIVLREGDVIIERENLLNEEFIKEVPTDGIVNFSHSSLIKIDPNPLHVKNGKGIAYIKAGEGVVNYKQFLEKEEIKMLKGMCDLKKVYFNLEEKETEIYAKYKNIGKELSVKVKTWTPESLISLLKDAGCFKTKQKTKKN